VKPYVKVFRLPNSPLPLLGYEHPIPYTPGLGLDLDPNGTVSGDDAK
jgi:hypothetical protein